MAVVKPGVKQIQFPADSPYGSTPLEITSLGSPVLAIAHSLLENINGKDLSTSYKTVALTGLYPGYSILKLNNSELTETEAKAFVKLLTGSDFLCSYSKDEPAYSYVVTSNKNVYKLEYKSNGLKAFYITQLQERLIAGSGITITPSTSGSIISATGIGAAVWGNIAGNIEDQTDLTGYVLSHHTMYNTNSLTDSNIDNILIAGGVVLTAEEEQLLADLSLALTQDIIAPANMQMTMLNSINMSEPSTQNEGLELTYVNSINQESPKASNSDGMSLTYINSIN